MKNTEILYCPIPNAVEHLPFDYAEIEPLLEFLFQNKKIQQDEVFERGTVTTLGQLDCCKQDLGAAGAALLSDALKYNESISSILLGTGAIGNNGAKSVSELIKHNQTIKTIYLGCNYIETEGITHLSEALKINNSVNSLWLKRNPIQPDGALKIAELLRENNNIRTLDLVNTLIGSEGLKSILDVLIENNYPIKRLYLSGNQLQSKDGEIIRALLEQNTHLEELLLSVNHLGAEGTAMIAEGLEKNQKLKNLSLASNHISSEGICCLLQSLEQHPSLVMLDLGYSRSTKVLGSQANQFDDRAAFVLKAFLEKNKTLRFLDISRNQLTVKGLSLIEKGLSNNSFLQKLVLGKGIQQATKASIRERLEHNKNLNLYTFQVSEDVKVIRSRYR